MENFQLLIICNEIDLNISISLFNMAHPYSDLIQFDVNDI